MTLYLCHGLIIEYLWNKISWWLHIKETWLKLKNQFWEFNLKVVFDLYLDILKIELLIEIKKKLNLPDEKTLINLMENDFGMLIMGDWVRYIIFYNRVS